MFLKKIKIPDFRVLKNVELHFEPEFTPAVFPLGSLNGGGKSTLLQLVFILLHCSFNSHRHKYLSNILAETAKKNPDELTVAGFDILHNDKEFSVEFVLHPNSFQNKSFNCFLDIEDIEKKIYYAENLRKIYAAALSMQEDINRKGRVSHAIRRQVGRVVDRFVECSNDMDSNKKIIRKMESPSASDAHFKNVIELLMENTEYVTMDDLDEMLSLASADAHNLKESLRSNNLLYVSHITNDKVLLCKTNADIELLKEISSKVYLSSPITQILLFLSEDEKQAIFSTENHNIFDYSRSIIIAREDMPGLFTSDFESPNVISNAFKMARDKDFKEALVSDNYGESLKKLKKELHHFLIGKTITISPDFSRVIFKLESGDDELSPEDLSHGELKKLGIYVWLNSYDIQDSLVLMDEIEIGLHPDWQYEIVNELQEWSSGNQFILATHSYELCQAVTPSHVKELEPKLMNK